MNLDEKRKRIEAALRRCNAAAPIAAPAAVAAVNAPSASPVNEPIAIVGCAGQFPRCASLTEFWSALDRGESLIEEIPADRFRIEEFYDATGTDPKRIRSKWGGFLPEVGGFDPLFFGIAPADAKRMDPRQRLLLMAVHHALEDAGHAPDSLKGSNTGVFIAGEENQYAQTLLEHGIDPGEGHAASLLANRISYCFDFRGPSEVIDTMCSGAAVAIYRAVQALHAGQVAQAVVGAVNLILRPDLLLQLSRTGQLSPENTVHSFGAKAAGSLRAEGVGAVLLKPLSRAIADGDDVYAVIRHAAVNFNGRGGMSMSAPQTAVHAELIEACYRDAGVAAARIGYIEAQGMGSPVADIAEWEACNRALANLASAEAKALPPGHCRISTLKPLTGHMNSASALGALFKIVHSLQTGTVYPIPGFTTLNPVLDTPGQLCRPVIAAEAWPKPELPRIAGLHSYGAGGNNAHLIVEEAVAAGTTPRLGVLTNPPLARVMIFSGRTPDQLRAVLQQTLDFVREHRGVALSRLAYTLQVGRSTFEERAALTAANADELCAKLEMLLSPADIHSFGWRGRANTGTGAAAQKLGRDWLQSHSAEEIAAHWTRGAQCDWREAYGGSAPQRLHFPGYPFARHRYWWTDIAPSATAAVSVVSETHSVSGVDLEPRVAAALKHAVARLLEVPLTELTLDRPLIDFGFDSVKFMDFGRQLAKEFRVELSPTVFFAHPTLAQLARYFSTQHAEAMQAMIGQTSAAAKKSSAPAATPAAAAAQSGAFPEPIAIIGLSGRFPQSRSVEEMWTLLAEGRNAVEEIPADRFDWRQAFKLASADGAKTICRWCGTVPGAAEFDALFFEISPLEAETMDPRQRLLLQEAWNALEDAAIGPAHLATRTIGMFVGAEEGDYPQQVRERTLTSSHDGVLAARLAYFLNLKGPVMTINTACSSSLVATHQACMSLRAGECDVALAAGVNLMLSPAPYVGMSQAGMLSPDGVCHVFDQSANGIVPGEAVCVVVLKRLSQALADGDPIRAVIRGSGINYDGKTNGLTAPNGTAQTELIRSVQVRHGIDAARVQHLVTHGTGTRLGDPVEVNALNDAFKPATSLRAYCALTSTKANFGHAFAASGLVSLIALVESLRRGIIPASLHCTRENEFIQWQDSPFYVNKAARVWPDTQSRERVGAVSAFGMSGTNAHVIVESFTPSSEPRVNRAPAYLLVFSAKTEEALQQRVDAIRAWLQGAPADPAVLGDVSHTLLDGRHHFRRRLALVVRDVPEAIQLLQEIHDAASLPVFRGTVSDQFTADATEQRHVNALLKRAIEMPLAGANVIEDLRSLAAMYCEGYSLVGSAGKSGSARRIPLPGYPFARKRHWATPIAAVGASRLRHPLLGEGASDSERAQFTASFSGEEFFLADHVVQGRKMLPGVAYLEMARAAFAERSGEVKPGSHIRLSNIAWARPFVADTSSCPLRLRFTRGANGETTYEIFSEAVNGQPTPAMHSQGVAAMVTSAPDTSVTLAELKTRITGPRFGAEVCRAAFVQMGLGYGPGFQALEEVTVGANEVLARLALPANRQDTLGEFTVHPGMLDGALQAAVGFVLGSGSDLLGKSSLPFSLEAIDVFRPCTRVMWAWLRRTKGSEAETIQKLDVDLFDDSGALCVTLRRFATRVLETAPVIAASAPADIVDLTLLWPFWDSVSVPLLASPSPLASEQVLVVGDGGELFPAAVHWDISADDSVEQLTAKIRELGALDHVAWIAPAVRVDDITSEAIVMDQARGVLPLFRLVKALLAAGYAQRPLAWTILVHHTVAVHAGERNEPTHAAIHGLVGSLAKEYPQWKIRLLDLDGTLPGQKIFTLPFDPQGDPLAYRNGEWFKQSLVPARVSADEPSGYREGGVYVVIGGAGGIGAVWTRYLVERYRAHVFWIGRREITPEIDRKISDIAAIGPAPVYVQADATNRGSLEGALNTIKQRHPRVHGVLHSAIVLLDKGLGAMTEEVFRAALEAKVDVSVRIAQVFERESLDFVLFFSSVTAFQKAAGQSNYAAGCTFGDAFARRLGAATSAAVKVMNWSYWGSVGAVSDPAYRARMERAGIGSIEPAEGMQALETLLRAPVDQLAFIKTLGADMRAQMLAGPSVRLLPCVLPSGVDAVASRTPPPGARADDLELPAMLQGQTMDRLLLQLLRGHLRKLNLLGAERSGLPKLYDRWLTESHRLLGETGLLRGDVTTDDIPAVWAEWDRLKAGWSQDANQAALVVLVETCMRALPEILDGTIPATDRMFPNSSMELVEAIYQGNRVADLFNELLGDAIVTYIEERLARDPAAKIRLIEIGAGTGGTTALLLPRLRRFRHAIEEYCYTDISKAFLMHAQERYVPENPFVTTKIFDAEQPPSSQGIALDRYDIALATNCLHATKNMRQTLRNVKATLRNRGVLCLNEMLVNPLCLHVTFGLLDGWWRFEDDALRIQGSPGLEPDTWKRLLAEEGFAHAIFPAVAAHRLGQQIIVSESDGAVWQKPVAALAAPVSSSAKPNGTTAAPRTGGSSAASGRALAEQVRSVIRRCVGESLKMDDADIHDDRSFSEYGVDSIIAVQLTNRINQACKITLQTTVLFDYTTVERLAQHIVDQHAAAVQGALGAGPATESTPPPANRAQTKAAPMMSVGSVAVRAAALRALITGPGSIDELSFTDADLRSPRGREVQIVTRAFSLNFADLLCVKGLYPNMPPYPFTPGVELSGVVSAVGSDVTSVRVGDAVICVAAGCHAEVMLCSEDDVLLKPATLSFEEACSVPAVAITMVDAFRKADIQRGERILIQTAAGGVGLIAVQLAQHAGAEIIATAGSQRKLDYLRGLGIEHVINYRDSDFEAEVQRITGGRGVDVVINTLPGDAIQKGLRCLAAGGRYIEIAMTALKSAKSLDLSVLSDNQTFFSIDLGKLHQGNPQRVRALRAEMVRLLEAGVIRPTISRVFAFDELREAYRALENRENIGKIVVQVAEPAAPAIAQTTPAPQTASVPTSGSDEPIAIIGMSGRFAKSETLDDFWEHLARGENLVEKVSRWDLSHLAADACRHGSFVESIDRFDPHFFNISGLEATYMDPQQRLFLEESWKALEDAGCAGEELRGKRCGVYVGCDRGNYPDLFNDQPPPQAFWGNTGAVIPARIAYFLDLQGPAIAVDTACSSSLVAIHLACQGLRAGDAEVALAGGVFLQVTSTFYYVANRAGMLSPSGACRAFDRDADGFVPGEGVGAVVLKRLSSAIADGDHVLGIIRGSATNQDGHTNGITAPSALSQERLERQVYDGFKINPEHIQLVEAHGTGTKLGDPIEFSALSRAFRHYTQKKAFCALGSVKTNIGHTATAAGTAGVLKILLSMRHGKIPPSLHYGNVNPDIAMQDSPFVVNTTLRDWIAPAGQPRRAAISSFGFSGTNAHIVLEESLAPVRRTAARPGYLIALSAQSPAQLRTLAVNLVARVERDDGIDLGAVSQTLLVGRRHLGHRLACVVTSRAQLVEQLAGWLAGTTNTQVRVSTAAVNAIREQPALRERGEAALDASLAAAGDAMRYREQLSLVVDLYVQGYRLPYERLFGGERRRVSLPTYPFAQEHYWVEKTDARPGGERGAPTSVSTLHPLVHRNVSDLTGIRFASRFTGAEFFLNDHQVRGRKVLPGVATLEMARAAVAAAHGVDERTGLRIAQWVWLQPLVLTGDFLDVQIEVRRENANRIDFEITTSTPTGEKAIHARGHAAPVENVARPEVDLSGLKQQMRAGSLDPEACYRQFRELGQEYGPGHRSLRQILLGDEQLLAEVSLPPGIAATREQFVLHPSLLDGALQTTIALAGSAAAGSGRVYLPFAVETIDVFAPCSERMWAWIRRSNGGSVTDTVQKIDVDLCDDTGAVAVSLRGFSSRPVATTPLPAPLHSLLHASKALTGEVSFTSRFTGREYILDEHRVDGVPTMPAVVYLEMARAAAALAGAPIGGLKQIVWSRPLQVLADAIEVTTELSGTAADRGVRVTSGTAHHALTHFQATTLPVSTVTHEAAALEAIRARCERELGAEDGSRIFGQQAFGTSGRTSRLQTLIAFQHNAGEALATLERAGDADGELDPGMMDGVLTAVHLHHALRTGSRATLLPFSIEEVRWFAVLPKRAWVHVRAASCVDASATYDVDVIGEGGVILVTLRGYVLRALSPARRSKVVFATPKWELAPLGAASGRPDASAPVFVFGEVDASWELAVRERWPAAGIERLTAATPSERLLQLFHCVQRLVRAKSPRVQPLFVITSPDKGGGFSGLLRTARLEQEKLLAKVIQVTGVSAAESLDQIAAELAVLDGAVEVRIARHERWVKRLTEVTLPPATESSVRLAPGEVVWITGGLGGLAQKCARHFSRMEGVKVVLTGRSAASVPDALRAGGAEVYYLAADVGDAASVCATVAKIEREIGPIGGILHAAGVLRDSYLVDKTEQHFAAVLWPKVNGVLALDEATRHCELRFFALFSSLAGVTGGPGQADYAAANAFLDEFAVVRNVLVRAGERRGVTRSINWPLWREGGMQMDEAAAAMMERSTGITALETEAGLASLVQILSHDLEQVIVAPGDPVRIRAKLLRLENESVANVVNPSTDAALVNAVRRDLARRVCSLQKIPADKVDFASELSVYGFDSISFTGFANHLNAEYGLELMPTVFFEHASLGAMADHLVARYPQQMQAKLGTSTTQQTGLTMDHTDGHGSGGARRVAGGKAAASAQADKVVMRTSTSGDDRIAVIGMSGRFPGSKDLEAFWKHLEANDDLISEVPAERWDWRARYGDAHTEEGKTRIKWGGFIEGVDHFDPAFFGISRREAESMDPQQRLLMQYVWLAIEDAGYAPAQLAGTDTALLIGTGSSGRQLGQSAGAASLDMYGPTGMVPSVGPNRMSYFLDLHGPSEPVETACSSALVAIHRAVGCIRSGECEQAIVGGVNTVVSPEIHVSLDKAGMLSPDGRSKTFSKQANGYARGEGVGMLFLKRLSAAERDGDQIYGVIVGSAENHGGRANSLTAPNPTAQAALLKKAYVNAGVDPRTVSYIETHGTGTELGDPIEIGGLKTAFRELYAQFADSQVPRSEAYCGLGSVKSNIGHLELAAGVAGVIKVLLQMQHRKLVKTLHCADVNPYIELPGSPFYLVQENRAWVPLVDREGRELPRRAGVSSFGFGGVNAHVVLEEYRPVAVSASCGDERPAVIVLSARNPERLHELAVNLLDWISQPRRDEAAGLRLCDIAYTLQIGRNGFEERLGFVANSLEDLREKLRAFVSGTEASSGLFHRGQVKKHQESAALFTADEELREAVTKWMERGKYDRLVDAWTKGVRIEWARLHQGTSARRVRLPGYPFARESFLPTPALPARDPGVTRFLQKQWSPRVLSPSSTSIETTGAVAILSDGETRAFAERLARELSTAEIVDIAAGGSRSTDWKRYRGVIDLLGCSTGAGLLAGLEWVQRAIEHGSRDGLKLLGVTQGVEPLKNERVEPAGAPRAALYRLLQSEYTFVRSRHVDLEVGADEAERVRQIVGEFNDDTDCAESCHRGGTRHVATLADVPAPKAGNEFKFPADKVLWISGGTRGLGALCARHFVEKHGVKRLVLSGREALPPRGEWTVASARGDATAQKIASILLLESLGAEVRVIATPLTDLAALGENVRAVASEWGSIGGLIHCAGVLDTENPAFIRKTTAGMERVLEPKVVGARNLIEALQDQPLELCVLFSSVSAAIPLFGAGGSDYAMANAYLDALAHAHASTFPVLSIQWPAWAESGMGGAPSDSYRNAGFLALPDAEGLRLLDAVLPNRFGPVILPARVNPALWKPEQLLLRRPAAVAPKRPRAELAATTAPVGTEENVSAWVAALTTIFATEMRTDPAQIDVNTPFADYGVDSIMLAQISRKIAQGSLKEFDPSLLYEHTTLAELAQALAGKASAATPMADATPAVAASKPETTDAVAPAVAIPRTAAISRIAVVGMSGRFAGADNLDAYWRLLVEGRSGIAPVPASRRSGAEEGYAGLIEPVTAFDSSYFLIPPEDARAMDPQALLVLEESLRLFCDAGYSPKEIRGRSVGVYLGARSTHQPLPEDLRAARNAILATGHNYLAANLSQFYDLRGPSVVVDTACSSALVGMHMAMQALASGEIEAAVVGGMSVLSNATGLQMFEQRNLLSRAPEFHLFDRRASGIILGEGCGLVLLKTVEQAERDGDRIVAIVSGLAINNDGRTAGPATPNIKAQQAVMRAALAKSGRSADAIQYVEVNGSGSEVTDLLELKALQSVYRPASTAPCSLGSMKPNLGHPLCAEGIAGFIKLALMIERGQTVPFLSGQEPMTHFNLEQSPFSFCRQAAAWSGSPRIAALNCFADGGTNAHVILEQYVPVARAAGKPRSPLPVPVLQRVPLRETKFAAEPALPAGTIARHVTPALAPAGRNGHRPQGPRSRWKRGAAETP